MTLWESGLIEDLGNSILLKLNIHDSQEEALGVRIPYLSKR